MAQRVQVNMIDDLNGEEAQETVRFGIDGTNYEIDLTAENAQKLRSTLTEYVDKGRRARTGRQGQSGPRTSPASTSTSRSAREETQRIRQWAKDNGHNPSSRGRINQSIVDAYNDAQK
jgi:hypothetical protein